MNLIDAVVSKVISTRDSEYLPNSAILTVEYEDEAGKGTTEITVNKVLAETVGKGFRFQH